MQVIFILSIYDNESLIFSGLHNILVIKWDAAAVPKTAAQSR